MSPYVVTTKRPPVIPVLGAINEPKLAREGIKVERDADGIATAFVSRRAAATLDEARARACGQVLAVAVETGDPLPRANLACERIPESGGTVGPLPDGTVIEVERVTWMHLGMQTAHPGWSGQLADDQILAAFNAAQEATR